MNECRNFIKEMTKNMRTLKKSPRKRFEGTRLKKKVRLKISNNPNKYCLLTVLVYFLFKIN